MLLYCAVDLMLGANAKSQDVVEERVRDNRVRLHELHVLAISEETGSTGTLRNFGGWVWLLYGAGRTLWEEEVGLRYIR